MNNAAAAAALDPKLQANLLKARKHSYASFTAKTWASIFGALAGWKFESVGTRMDPAYVVTAPNGKSLKIVKKAGYRVVTFYEMWDMLKKTSFDADVAQVLGMEVYDSNATYVRTREGTGTCPACFRNIKLDKAGKMVNHGYERPGHGYIVGNCFCVGYQPYELSPKGTQDFLEKAIRPALPRQQSRLQALKDGRVTEFKVMVRDHSNRNDWSAKKEHTVKKGDRYDSMLGVSSFEQMLTSAVRETERNIETIVADIAAYEKLINDWKLAPLPEAGKKVKDGR